MLSGHDPAPERAPSWAVALAEFPVVAEPYRPPVATYTVRRAPMRKGTMRLTGEGVRLEGRGLPDQNVFSTVSTAAYAVWIFLLVARLPFSSVPFRRTWVFSAFQGLVFVTALTAATLGEYRRVAREDFFPWEQVEEFWFEQNLRWAALIYRTEDTKGRVRHFAVPLNFQEPSLCGALRDSVEQWSPGKTRVGGVVYEWTLRRRAVAFVVVVGFFLFLVWAFTRY